MTTRIILAIYWIVLFIATHLPPRRMVSTGWNDKLQHFIAYAILAALLYLVFERSTWPLRRTIGVAVSICLIYGAIDEWTQPLIGRDCELLDWFADAAGAIVGATSMAMTRIAASRVRR